MKYIYSSELIQGLNKLTVKDDSLTCEMAVIHSNRDLVIGDEQIPARKNTQFKLPSGEFEINVSDGPAVISIVWFGEVDAKKTETLDSEMDKAARSQDQKQKRSEKAAKKKAEEEAKA